METAESVVVDILEEIYAAASEQPIESPDFAKTLRFMNRYMSQLDAEGIALGYTKVSRPTDPITIPDGAINGLIFNVALLLVNSGDIPVNNTLNVGARNGLAAMRRIAVKIPSTSHPCTLPIGSGNEGDNFDLDHFYPCPDATILAETNGSISLEDNTDE